MEPPFPLLDPLRMQEPLQCSARVTQDAHWDWDLISGDVYFAPQWWKTLGYEVNALPTAATLWASFCHPDDGQRFDEVLTSALASTEEGFQLEHRLRHIQGHYVPVLTRAHIRRDTAGKPTRLSGINTELTEHKPATWCSVGVRESRFRALTELTSDWYWEQDANFRFTRMSDSFPADSRINPGNCLGRTRWELLHAGVTDAQWAAHRAVLQARRTFHEFEMQRPTHDGNWVWISVSGVPVFDSQGVFMGYWGVGRDIAARKQTDTVLRESEDRFRTLTHLSSDWYWEQDENYRFTLVSGEVFGSTGLNAHDHIGKFRWDVQTLNLNEADWDRHRAVLDARQEFRDFELRLPDSAERMHWASVSGTPMFHADGTFKGYRGIGRDITAKKQAGEQIHRLAFYDALTGLPNRRLLLEQLKKILQINARHGMRGALLFIDLDNFKTLNDTLGHDVGDLLLQQVAKRLVTCVREADTVARLGGDEFVVVLEDLNDDELEAAAQAEAVGQKILASLNSPYQLAGRDHRSSPSIGITLFGGDAQWVDDLLKQADLAMYQAKASGRNTLRFFDIGMQSEVESRVALESDLRDGLQGGEELELHFQGMFDSDGRVTGAEALVRWQQPNRGLVMPADFIPLAESTGLIFTLGRWVLQTACEQLALWAQRPEMAHLTLAVNVSARQLREPDFVSLVLNTLQRTGANASRLRLELTESVLIHHVEDTIVKMNTLKAVGVGFSLDDFGTGYSSLSYLKQLPLDLLKIDHSFVRDVLTDPNDAAIARTIVTLGHSLGLAIVAEGVETQEQREFLASIGCFAYQGFLFGGPVPIEQFDALVLAHT